MKSFSNSSIASKRAAAMAASFWRKVPLSETVATARRMGRGVRARSAAAADVEEDGLVLALQADVEAVDDAAVLGLLALALGDEGLATLLPLHQAEARV